MIIYAVDLNRPPYIHEMTVVRETAKQWHLDGRHFAVGYSKLVPKTHPMVFTLREDALRIAHTYAAAEVDNALDALESARALVEALK